MEQGIAPVETSRRPRRLAEGPRAAQAFVDDGPKNDVFTCAPTAGGCRRYLDGAHNAPPTGSTGAAAMARVQIKPWYDAFSMNRGG